MHDVETQPEIRGEGHRVQEGAKGAGRSIQGRHDPSAPLRLAGTQASDLRPQDPPDGRSAVPSFRARTGTTADTGSDAFEEQTVDCGPRCHHVDVDVDTGADGRHMMHDARCTMHDAHCVMDDRR